MTARCQGGCEKMVTLAGMWCSSCWVEAENPKVLDGPINILGAPFQFKSDQIRPTQDLQSLRFEIHSASFHLCFGRESERAEALERLIHLVELLRNQPPSGA